MGRNERRKGIIELNAVIRKLIPKCDFRISFIGPIPADMQIDSDKCEYHGVVQDSNELHRLADQCQVLICPSYSEGMPNVILEAMARGLAVVASDVGAISKMIDSSNGWLIPPGNTNQLMKAMEKAIRMPSEQILLLGDASIAKVESHFLWEDIAQITIKKIQEIIV